MWSHLSDYEIRHLPKHYAILSKYDELCQLIRNLGYLKECVIRNSWRFLLDTIQALISTTEAKMPSRKILETAYDILHSEAASLSDPSQTRDVASFNNQLINAAHRFDSDGFFILPNFNDVSDNLWMLLRRWSIGGDDRWLRQRITMPGNRSSFAIDFYDSGPMGCQTELKIDFKKRRLLTETVSYYSAAFHNYSIYFWYEWDLATGVVLREYKPVTIGEGTPLERPPSFHDFFENRFLGPYEELPKTITSQVTTDKLSDGLIVRPAAKSVNSNERVIIAYTTIKTGIVESNVFVLEEDNNKVLATHVRWPYFGFEIKSAVRLNEGLVAFATGSDRNVYRILILPSKSSISIYEEKMVSAISTNLQTQNIACIRTSGDIEIRDQHHGKICQSFRNEDINKVVIINEEASQSSYYSKIVSAGETSDKMWTTLIEKYIITSMSITGKQNICIHNRRVYSVDTGELLFELGNPPLISYGEVPVAMVISPSGKYIFDRWMYFIGIWDAHSGKWIGSLRASINSGAGYGILCGFAISPDEHFVISSDEGRNFLVWDLWNMSLDKSEADWMLAGLDIIENINNLVFFWGGELVAVCTEDHWLYVCTFKQQSQVLTSVRLPNQPTHLIGTPYGDCIATLTGTGILTCYQFIHMPSKDVTVIKGNTVIVRFRCPGALKVGLAGTFNCWDHTQSPMKTTDGELWTFELELADGHYEYKIVINDERWELDPHIPFVPCPYGFNNYFDLPCDNRIGYCRSYI